MIPVAEARATILSAFSPTPAETIALTAGLGRTLAADLHARLTQPPADVSAMDGYALRAADSTPGATLRVIGAAPAGHPFAAHLNPGETIRLFTGSVIPSGTDTILIQEDATRTGDVLTVNAHCPPGRHIRRAGQDFVTGSLLVAAGTRLTPRHLGLAAAGNHAWLSVHRQPRIAILATGDEIALPGDPLAPGGIISSNTAMLAAFVTAAGGLPAILPLAPDNAAAIAAAATTAAGCDLLLTTGGVSVGDHDLLQTALATSGLRVKFWKIAMRPGKPLMFGHLGALPVLGLPGNPVSAYICALLFLRPALARLAGLPATSPTLHPARLASALKPNDQREDYLRATAARTPDGWSVTPLPVQDSSLLQALTHANALLRRPPYDPARQEGDIVDIILIAEAEEQAVLF